MSKHLVNLVYGKTVGQNLRVRCSAASRKAVLVALADRANDDGSDIWVSKTRVAAELECSRETVKQAIKSLEADGILQEVGTRPGRTGFTYVYKISVGALARLPSAWESRPDLGTLDDALADGDEPVGAILRPVGKSVENPVNNPAKAPEDLAFRKPKVPKSTRQGASHSGITRPNRSVLRPVAESLHRRADPEYAREGVSGSPPGPEATRMRVAVIRTEEERRLQELQVELIDLRAGRTFSWKTDEQRAAHVASLERRIAELRDQITAARRTA